LSTARPGTGEGETISRAKHVLSNDEGNAKDAKIKFDKKRGEAVASLASLAR